MIPILNSVDSPERGLTDASLRDEREKADQELSASRLAVDKDADAVVEHARDAADAVMEAAREKADEKAEASAHEEGNVANQRATQNAIELDRRIEDQDLVDERAAADRMVQRERDARSRMLRRILPLERDATDQYLLTERARSDDALATRDDFLGMVSHDLRDLLNGVMMSSQFLAQKLAKHSDSEQLLLETNRITRYGARMNRLIGDLVDIVSIDSGRLAMHAAAGDVAALVVEAADALQESATAKGISLEATPPTQSSAAVFDHDRMLQVLANLIANSVKFTPTGGNVRVVCECVGDLFEFCVEDTGEGIPADMLEIVFERFWQVGKSDRRGLGLGLYISRCIVEAHGGSIRASSRVGQGTKMLFTLPVNAKRDG